MIENQQIKSNLQNFKKKSYANNFLKIKKKHCLCFFRPFLWKKKKWFFYKQKLLLFFAKNWFLVINKWKKIKKIKKKTQTIYNTQFINNLYLKKNNTIFFSKKYFFTYFYLYK